MKRVMYSSEKIKDILRELGKNNTLLCPPSQHVQCVKDGEYCEGTCRRVVVEIREAK